MLNKKKNCHEIFFSEWIDIINSFLEENNITVDDNVVFRPYYHNDIKTKEEYEQIEYFRITKEDLCLCEDYIDYEDSFLFMLKST